MRPNPPQRLTRFSPPGALLKRLDGLHQRIRTKQTTERDPVYLKLIRQCPCLKCGMEPSEAAHVRLQSAAHGKRGGIGAKPSDRWAVSLCAACHARDPDSQHRIGERLFWYRLGIDPLQVATKLYAVRGDLVAMRAVVLAAIGERK